MRPETHSTNHLGSDQQKLGPARAALILTAIGALFLGACSTGPGGIQNGGELDVKPYYLNPTEKVETVDPMIAFERQHLMHGAISASDQQARFGHYYAIHWKVDDRMGPVTVRLDYRQTNTGLETKVKEQTYDEIKRRNRTEFRVVGEEYFTDGEVTSFKISLLRGDEVLATSESFAWKD